jgi:hypothetical protein
VLSPLAGVLRLASIVLCLIVIVSFALFVVDQTGSASAHQQAELNNETTATGVANPSGGKGAAKDAGKSTVRKTIDETSESITSPFSFATEATSSEWLSRAIGLALTLLVYGFALSFVARTIRVRT